MRTNLTNPGRLQLQRSNRHNMALQAVAGLVGASLTAKLNTTAAPPPAQSEGRQTIHPPHIKSSDGRKRLTSLVAVMTTSQTTAITSTTCGSTTRIH